MLRHRFRRGQLAQIDVFRQLRIEQRRSQQRKAADGAVHPVEKRRAVEIDERRVGCRDHAEGVLVGFAAREVCNAGLFPLGGLADFGRVQPDDQVFVRQGQRRRHVADARGGQGVKRQAIGLRRLPCVIGQDHARQVVHELARRRMVAHVHGGEQRGLRAVRRPVEEETGLVAERRAEPLHRHAVVVQRGNEFLQARQQPAGRRAWRRRPRREAQLRGPVEHARREEEGGGRSQRQRTRPQFRQVQVYPRGETIQGVAQLAVFDGRGRTDGLDPIQRSAAGVVHGLPGRGQQIEQAVRESLRPDEGQRRVPGRELGQYGLEIRVLIQRDRFPGRWRADGRSGRASP